MTEEMLASATSQVLPWVITAETMLQLPVPEAAWIDNASCGPRPSFLHGGTQPYEKAPEPMLVL
ncbi:hypothetical protein E4U60_005158 [Claviceps pazoutovae]|uniref:Uncharacterized protein n=1 Tax=Claviceps pazoutovae TaxID=1649127 RepID=A0A9P7M7Z8_9HYPO|nr:hypothetical protein E4U60_005158 [Claviceps pazoutovae]